MCGQRNSTVPPGSTLEALVRRDKNTLTEACAHFHPPVALSTASDWVAEWGALRRRRSKSTVGLVLRRHPLAGGHGVMGWLWRPLRVPKHAMVQMAPDESDKRRSQSSTPADGATQGGERRPRSGARARRGQAAEGAAADHQGGAAAPSPRTHAYNIHVRVAHAPKSRAQLAMLCVCRASAK